VKLFSRTEILFALALLLLFSSCTPYPSTPQPVTRSFYLNKKYLRFILDHGDGYRTVRLANGDEMHYWRSDQGGLIALAAGWDDRSPDYCEIALETDPAGIVRKIYIIEPSSICNTVLK
jgi:hypothetical protein